MIVEGAFAGLKAMYQMADGEGRVWRAAVVVTVITLVYGAGNLAWRNDAVALALAALAATAIWFVVRRYSERLRDAV